MSTENACLALRLQGPLQSWGFESQYNNRTTGMMPTKSGIGGVCCAALGLPRGSDPERKFLARFRKLRMTAIAIPRAGAGKELPVRRLQDFQTVENTRKADGGTKPTHITHRQYLCDASFAVLLEGDGSLLREIARALAEPVWGIWLGRKTCIPSAPVLAGLADERESALRMVIGERPLEEFTRQEEVESFADGQDSLSDAPVSFASDRRAFSPRRVRTVQRKGES